MKILNVLILSGIALSSTAFAGPESSGGGAAAVCRDANHKIVSAQMLDLYEGQTRFGYKISSFEDSPREQVLRAIAKLPDERDRTLAVLTAGKIIHAMEFLPLGVGLSPTTDLGNEYGVLVPDGCEIEPVGFYESNGTLKVSRSVYKALSATDRAAFILHEAMYKLSRDLLNETDSADARRLVAAMLAFNTSSQDLADKSVDFGAAEWNLIVLSGNETDFTVRLKPSSNEKYHLKELCLDKSATGSAGIESPDEQIGPMTSVTITGSCKFIEIIAKNKDWTSTQTFHLTLERNGSSILDKTLSGDVAKGATYFIVLADQIDLPELPSL